MHERRNDDSRIAARATPAPTLNQRIADMEQRLALERSQAVAHTRAFRGDVLRRLTSPTSLVFSASMGFLAGELLAWRASRGARPAKKGASLRRAGKSLLSGLMKPLLSMLQLGSLGFLAKQSSDTRKSMQAAAQQAPPTLH